MSLRMPRAEPSSVAVLVLVAVAVGTAGDGCLSYGTIALLNECKTFKFKSV